VAPEISIEPPIGEKMEINPPPELDWTSIDSLNEKMEIKPSAAIKIDEWR
jgi:hypothetical protein